MQFKISQCFSHPILVVPTYLTTSPPLKFDKKSYVTLLEMTMGGKTVMFY